MNLSFKKHAYHSDTYQNYMYRSFWGNGWGCATYYMRYCEHLRNIPRFEHVALGFRPTQGDQKR